MFSSSLHLCQRCSSLLRSRLITHQSTNNVIAIHQQPLATSAKYFSVNLGLPPSFHSRLRSLLTFKGRTGTETPQGCSWSAQFQIRIKHACQKSEANNLVPLQQTIASSASLPVTEFPSVFDLEDVSPRSALEEISEEEAVQIVVPHTFPTDSTSLRDFVDKSETLNKLVQLGVDLWKLERRPNVASTLVRMDFQSDVAPRLLFLKDLGVKNEQLGAIITTNPFILTQDLDNLKTRVNYLISKKFHTASIPTMVFKAPYLLNFSVKRLDNRLSFYQTILGLNPGKTRDIITRLPRLLCGSLEPVKENLRVYELEFGFQKGEIQHMVTEVPKILTANKIKLTKIFDYLHNTMGIPHSLIAKCPQVLNSQFLKIKERHLFLKYLDRAQYDPSEPSYVSLERLVALPTDVFCTTLALATVEDFENFQKTL